MSSRKQRYLASQRRLRATYTCATGDGLTSDGKTLDPNYWNSGSFIVGPALATYVRRRSEKVNPGAAVRVHRVKDGNRALQVSFRGLSHSGQKMTLSYLLPQEQMRRFAEAWVIKK